MDVQVSDILSAAATLGLGSALSVSAAAEVSGLAVVVRERADMLAAEVADLSRESRRIEGELRQSSCPEWKGEAAERFRSSALIREQEQGVLSAELEDVAAQVRRAGQLLAAQLETLSASISSAGHLVDSAVNRAAEGAEHMGQAMDIARDRAVLTAQENLKMLVEGPQLGALKHELLSGGAR